MGRNLKTFLKNSFPEDAFSPPTVADFRAGCYEFLGTTLFLLFGLWGCQTAATMHADGPPANDLSAVEYCAKSFSLSLLLFVSVFFRVTGGVFNPSVALSLFLIGAMRFYRLVIYTIAQLFGSIVATGLLRALVPDHISVQTDLAPGVSLARGVFMEAFTTAGLVLAILLLAVDKRTLSGKTIAPVGIAAAVYIGHLLTLKYTGSAMNPARAFGPAVLNGGFHGTHWVYWVGPFIGSLCATSFYKYLQYSSYWLLGHCDGDSAGPLPGLSEKETTACKVDVARCESTRDASPVSCSVPNGARKVADEESSLESSD